MKPNLMPGLSGKGLQMGSFADLKEAAQSSKLRELIVQDQNRPLRKVKSSSERLRTVPGGLSAKKPVLPQPSISCQWPLGFSGKNLDGTSH